MVIDSFLAHRCIGTHNCISLHASKTWKRLSNKHIGMFDTLKMDMEFASLHILLNNALGNVGSINCGHTYSKHHHTVRTTSLLHLPKLPILRLGFLLFPRGQLKLESLEDLYPTSKPSDSFHSVFHKLLQRMEIQSFFRVSVHGFRVWIL